MLKNPSYTVAQTDNVPMGENIRSNKTCILILIFIDLQNIYSEDKVKSETSIASWDIA